MLKAKKYESNSLFQAMILLVKWVTFWSAVCIIHTHLAEAFIHSDSVLLQMIPLFVFNCDCRCLSLGDSVEGVCGRPVG